MTYQVHQAGKQLGHHWARMLGENDEGIDFELVSQLSRVVPAGGQPITIRASLRTDKTLAPLSFQAASGGRMMTITTVGGSTEVLGSQAAKSERLTPEFSIA